MKEKKTIKEWFKEHKEEITITVCIVGPFLIATTASYKLGRGIGYSKGVVEGSLEGLKSDGEFKNFLKELLDALEE